MPSWNEYDVSEVPLRALVRTREGRHEDQGLLGHFLALRPFLTTQNYHHGVRLDLTVNMVYIIKSE